MSDRRLERPASGERLSALIALVALGAATVLVLVGAVANWKSVLVTLIGLQLIVVGGWYAVSRHGMIRSVALLIGLIGAGLLIAGFIGSNLTAVRVGAIVVLAGLSVGAARYALHRSERALRGRPRSNPPRRRPGIPP